MSAESFPAARAVASRLKAEVVLDMLKDQQPEAPAKKPQFSNVSDDRPHCRDVSACKAKTPGKHCPPCTLASKWSDPDFREKRRAAFVNRLASDPEMRARHCARSAERLAKWRAETGGPRHEKQLANLELANAPEAIARRTAAIRARAYPGIPVERHAEVRALARKVPAAEAKRIVLAEVEAIERRRIDALSPLERQLERARVAGISERVAMPARVHGFSLTGGSLA